MPRPCELVALADTSAADKTAMMWYVLCKKELSGRGINSEAVIQLTCFCFAEMGLASHVRMDYGGQHGFSQCVTESWLT